MLPNTIFFTKGVGRHNEQLNSFEMALRDAHMAPYNLVNVSSIMPPGARIIPPQRGVSMIQPGSIVHVVMSRNSTNEPNRLIAASIGVAVPADISKYGYLSEHHSFGQTEQKAGDYAEDMAVTMLGSTYGIDVDPSKAYDERKEIYRMSGKIINTRNISQTAIGDKNGLWTTVVAMAVLWYDPTFDPEKRKPRRARQQNTDASLT
jgi:arginine decarboxylase